MIQKLLRKFFLVGVMVTASVPALGQDLLAKQAPIDRKLRTTDSVTLQRLLKTERAANVSNIYSTWSNSSVHSYTDASIPDTFRIDLRRFSMPTTSRQITSRFGYRPRFRRQHKGLDIKVYIGDTIRSAFDGKVRIVRYEARGYGQYVVIRHPNGLETIYGHLSKQLVGENEEVKAGTPIGLGGNTGRSTGSHLHFETRILGQAIDPELLFNFPAQDVTSDYYVYYSPRSSRNSAIEDYSGIGEDEMIDDDDHNHAPAKSLASTSTRVRYHKVGKGETLYSISRKLGMSVDQLRRQNGLTAKSKLRQGQILKY